jgi:tRNA U34 5-methylaminomethyl-2-thiouridine-forming methyltransferase MnmC
MKIEITETQDGSHTLYLESIDEHYHSTFGAVQESQHVFIQAGFDLCPAKDIQVLEVGFGTGLNSYLTLISSLDSGKTVHYYTVENNPLTVEIWEKLNFTAHFPEHNPELFSSLHQADWNCIVEIQKQFFLHKIEADLLQLDFKDMPTFDLVYFDAFSPDKQPELWDQSVFEKLYLKMKENSILVTYCAKGYVRRMLQSVGFRVERIPGPPGKREMIRARKE